MNQALKQQSDATPHTHTPQRYTHTHAQQTSQTSAAGRHPRTTRSLVPPGAGAESGSNWRRGRGGSCKGRRQQSRATPPTFQRPASPGFRSPTRDRRRGQRRRWPPPRSLAVPAGALSPTRRPPQLLCHPFRAASFPS